jgi:hypothetical protein
MIPKITLLYKFSKGNPKKDNFHNPFLILTRYRFYDCVLDANKEVVDEQDL